MNEALIGDLYQQIAELKQRERRGNLSPKDHSAVEHALEQVCGHLDLILHPPERASKKEEHMPSKSEGASAASSAQKKG
jgi:hypothetical protein